MGCKPEKLVVWNEIMRTEAVTLHDIRAEDVYVCGPAHFDVYAHSGKFRSREEFCRDLRLDPAKPIIVQGTITPMYYPENVEVLEMLTQAIENRRFVRDCQLLVRLHPQVVNTGIHSDDLAPYRAIEQRHDFVRIDVPRTTKWGSMVSPHREEAKHLAEILYHAAVLVHPGSTLVVDAAAVNCPAVGLGFDGYKPKPYDESIRRWWDYTYMQPIVQSGGQPIARTAEELLATVNLFLKDRNHLVAGRTLIRDQECYKIDGCAGSRIAARLTDYMAE